jgi:2-polyprenyl-3-methyl-5-hydroxy-6-metoxy-1,4-benzoquinol methylase
MESSSNTGTSKEVIEYYSKNWDKIANCYSLDQDNLPIDPAFYRRRLYNEFLENAKPKSVLDIGCGGGWTVLDALKKGVNATGLEPIKELKEFGNRLLYENGFDPNCITQNDLASLSKHSPESQDCIALLSVLPHVPNEQWSDIHKIISSTLKKGGYFVAAYRNELFDLYTFNSITMEFYDNSLLNNPACNSLRTQDTIDLLKGLITNPNVPGPYFTAAKDSSFGKLERIKSNPMTMPNFLEKFGFKVDRIRFYNFHCVPPILSNKLKDFKRINHEMELSMADDWRAYFMSAMFFLIAVKE